MKAKSDVAIINSPQMKQLVKESMQEIDSLYALASNVELNTPDVKKAIEAIYLRNLKYVDEPVVIAKKLLAEGLTRIELDKMRVKDNQDEKMLSTEFKEAVKMTETLCKLVKDLEPKSISRLAQIDDDKMVFEVIDGVYEEK